MKDTASLSHHSKKLGGQTGRQRQGIKMKKQMEDVDVEVEERQRESPPNMEEEREKGKEKKEEEEFLGLKLLKRGNILVGKSKGGVCTPPPTWTFEPHFQQQQQDPLPSHTHTNNNIIKSNVNLSNSTTIGSSSVTARQLGANLWEVLPHLNSLAKMSNSHRKPSGFSRLPSTAHKNKGLEMHTPLEDPPDTASDDQAVSTGSFHRQIAASLMRHHRSVDRNGRALQPVSPASYCSSMEVTPYNPAATPSSSIDYKGRLGDPSYSLKTSTELLKVLNRIWCLEEQHASNVSLVKALRTELDNSRSRIKDLLREKQMDRQLIDDLMKQVAEHKLVKKNMEQERVQSALQSLKEELEAERKLRKRSESMHRKLAQEVSQIKFSFSKALDELETERRARVLLEELCDEFAMGIRDYEQELRSLKYRTEKEQVTRDHVDSLVLHISEAWLDERVQMKVAEDMHEDMRGKSTVMDKLRPEIETFLKARQTLDSRENTDFPTQNSKGSGLRRQSLESFPLNEATSAPQNDDNEDDDDSIDSDSHCFELNRNMGGEYSNAIHTKNADNSAERGLEETVKTDTSKRKGESQEVSTGRNLSSLQARFEKHMARMISSNGNSQEAGTPVETNTSNISGNQESCIQERRSKRFGNRGGSAILMLDNLLRTNSSSIEGERIHPINDLPDDSHGQFLVTSRASPVKKWDSKITSQDPEMLESSSRWPRGSKESSLKAKLLEARLEGRSTRSKGCRGTT